MRKLIRPFILAFGLSLAGSLPLPALGAVPSDATAGQREGFALRLSLYMPTQDPSTLRAARPDSQHAAEGLFGCARTISGMPHMELFDANRLVEAGRFDAARESYTNLLARGEGAVDPMLSAAAIANLGVVAAAQGRYPDAKEKLDEALRRYQAQEAAPVMPGGGMTASKLTDQLSRMGISPNMVDINAAMANVNGIRSALETSVAGPGVLRLMLNLGNLSGQLGQYADAEVQFKRALDQAAKIRVPGADAVVYAEFAVLYRQANKPEAAADALRRASAAPPAAANALGSQLIALGRSSAPVQTNPRSAEAEQNRPSHYAEAAQLRMQIEAKADERAGKLADAALVYSRSAVLAASVETPEREEAALADLARVQTASNVPDLAIFSGKRAVNAAQRLRGEVQTMERQARQAYLAHKRRTYTTLAGLLMQQGRLAEAELVLRLLKEDEGQQFRPALTADTAQHGSVPYTLTETKYESRYVALASQTHQLEAQRQALQCGMFGAGAAIDDRDQQEQFRIQMALQMDSIVSQMEGGKVASQLSPRLARARTIAAVPASARSAADRQFLVQFQQAARVLNEMYAGMAASLRNVRRDGPYFVHPLSATDGAKIDALAMRVSHAQAELASQLTLLANEPVPPRLDREQMVLQFLNFGMDKSQGSWGVDRQLEGLDAERGRLDAELLEVLGGSGQHDKPTFTPTDGTLLDTGRKLLGELPAGTVAIYYSIGERQLDILVVGREGRRSFSQPVGREQLDQRIRALRKTLQDRRLDPSGPAKGLYDLLIAPLEGALREAKAKTLMLSLDGQLRYLPFAALYDGHGWLVERYAIDLYTTAAPLALTAAPAPKWRVAAFGSTAGGDGFTPLPAVRHELEGVVRDPALKTQGVLPGVIRLDRSFTAAALRASLREKQNVVHIASHFSFRAGDASASFLLLGDGRRLSLADMTGPDYRFDQVDLVTLSACETALSGDDSFGQEVEGLGTLLQGQGAAAVLATLWSVEDESTAMFMRSLYAGREQRGLSRAQAVREAQLSLVRGETGTAPALKLSTVTATTETTPSSASPSLGDTTRGAFRPGDEQAETTFRADPSRRWAHPYFWAPFVLMGNWL